MTKTIYITGDRALDPINSVAIAGKAIAILLLENEGEKVRFVTGTEGGVEGAVRFILPPKALEVIERPKADEGWTDWDKSHAQLVKKVDFAVVLHGDPLASRIGKSVSTVFPEDKVRFLMQEQPEPAKPEQLG